MLIKIIKFLFFFERQFGWGGNLLKSSGGVYRLRLYYKIAKAE